jgi:hypothetical protein
MLVPFAPDADLVCVSQRDVLLQLYVERRIARVELLAGRTWQHLMEHATVQPCASVRFDQPVFQQGKWQPDGDLTDGQWEAIRRRAAVRECLGRPTVNFLDETLAPDVGRGTLRRRHGDRAREQIDRLCASLKELAVELGLSSRPTASGVSRESSAPASREQKSLSGLIS